MISVLAELASVVDAVQCAVEAWSKQEFYWKLLVLFFW